MNELLSMYVETVFSPEMQEQINRSFDFFDYFEYKEAYAELINIISNGDNTTKEMMQDLFIREIHYKLNYVLEQHSITLIEEATIYEKNEIINALAFIQHLEDYTGIIRTLETFEPDEVQLATVLAEISLFDKTKIMSLVESFSPTFLENLKKYVYTKEENKEEPTVKNTKIVKSFRLFTRVFGDHTLGANLVRGQIVLGEVFERYLDFIQDIASKGTDEEIALNLLSVIYLSRDGFNSPLLVYRKYSYRVIQDLDKVSRVEVHLLNNIAKLNEHLKAEDEKNRLSQTVIEI